MRLDNKATSRPIPRRGNREVPLGYLTTPPPPPPPPEDERPLQTGNGKFADGQRGRHAKPSEGLAYVDDNLDFFLARLELIAKVRERLTFSVRKTYPIETRRPCEKHLVLGIKGLCWRTGYTNSSLPMQTTELLSINTESSPRAVATLRRPVIEFNATVQWEICNDTRTSRNQNPSRTPRMCRLRGCASWAGSCPPGEKCSLYTAARPSNIFFRSCPDE